MLNGLYSAGSAMDAAARRHEIISQNLANAQMPGYRRQTVMHNSRESQFSEELRNAVQFEMTGVDSGALTTDFTPGVMEQTGHPLDMAIQGEGFFVVEGPSGPLYTRNGTFQIDGEGRLVTADQLPVQGQSGEISIPPNFPISQLRVNSEGAVYANAVEVGRLQIVTFNDPQRLQAAGSTLFSSPGEMPPEEIKGRVMQNMRERSNVSPIHELVELIAAQRQQEAAQRSMTAINESVGKNINVQGR